MTRLDLDAVLASIERAYAEVGDIAKEGPARRWRMSIPANRERDSDLLIANALDAGRLMARELRAAREERSETAKRIKALEDALLPFVAMHPEMFKRADELFDDQAAAP